MGGEYELTFTECCLWFLQAFVCNKLCSGQKVTVSRIKEQGGGS